MADIGNDFVVYTAIANNYDFLRQVPASLRGLPFICFTDEMGVSNRLGWQTRPFPNNDSDPTRRCRDLKLNPHIYLPDYKYSLWVDSSIQLFDSITPLLIRLIAGDTEIAAFKHRFRNCIYEEAAACKDLSRDDPKKIDNQVAFLQAEGYPVNNGLAETGMMFRKHMEPSVISTMEIWNAVLVNYSKRDQLGFNYALWKTGSPVAYIDSSAREGVLAFKIGRHRTKGLRNIVAYLDAYSYFNPLYSVLLTCLDLVKRK